MSDPQIDPDHEAKRNSLRSLGIALMLAGGLLALVGIADFFSSMGSFGGPKNFWMAFIGLPMFSLGVKLAGFGFMGAITRYGAGEVAPVAKDALEYLKDASHSTEDLVKCPSCQTRNRPDAKFCDSCGSQLATICVKCGTSNDASASFCDGCGQKLERVG